MAYRLMLVSEEPSYASWLRHHIDTIWPDAGVRVLGLDEFRAKLPELTWRDCDLVVLHLPFGESPEDPSSLGLELLRTMRNREDLPLLLAIAEGGNELTAVRAVRLGVEDYVPRSMVTQVRFARTLRVLGRAIDRRALAEPAAPVESPGSTTPPVDALAITLQVPRYAITRRLGESEKSIVYLATSEDLQSEVALKVTRHDPGDEPSTHHGLAREYDAIASLRHPSIVQIYDYGIHGGREYLVMEYFPRGDLKARLAEPLSEDEAVSFIDKIAAALEVVHRAGLVHRDLKPANVMLREDDSIVLIDFGLAKTIGASLGSTRTGLLRGSPYYMSPEQAQGQMLDARTDLYSLGVMLYEMLAGVRPYVGATAIEVLQSHVSAPVPRLPRLVSAYQSLVDKLMAKNPADRFQSMSELRVALSPHNHTSTISAADWQERVSGIIK